MKTILSFDEGRAHAEIDQLKKAAQAIQPCLDELNQLDLGVPVRSILDVQGLIEKGSQWVHEKFDEALAPKKPVSVFGKLFEVQRAETGVKPVLPDMSKLDEVCESCRQGNHHYKLGNFTFENGKIEVGQSEITRIKENCRRYAVNKHQEDYHKEFQQIAASLDKIEALALKVMNRRTIADSDNFNLGPLVTDAFARINGKWQIKPSYYDRHSYDMAISANIHGNTKQLA